MAKLSDQDFAKLLDDVAASVNATGFTVESTRTIPYGRSLTLLGGGQLNLYNGKKGPSMMLAGKLLEPERIKLESAIDPLIQAHRVGEPTTAASQGETAPVAAGDSSRTRSDSRTDRNAPRNLLDLWSPWIGVDEAGKGDFFGPLVVCAVHVAPDQVEELIAHGLRDSKALGDARNMALSAWIEEHLPCEALVLMPVDYNERYAQFKNLNAMLAGAHAEVIARLQRRTGACIAISDDFGGAYRVIKELKSRKTNIALSSMPKAERDLAVACASVLARGRFLQALRDLSTEATMELPPGAAPQVVRAGRELVKLFGEAELGRYAKLHFKTRQDVLA